MSIPKRIYYCWFGDSPISKEIEKCIASWKKSCPDFEIIKVCEQNYDIYKIPYIRDAYKEKKWAFVSDYVRLDIIYNEGGIYLDTDVELIKSIDDFLNYESFWAIERDGCYINTGLIFGAVANDKNVKSVLDEYEKASFYKQDGTLNLKACTEYTTEYFESLGYKREDVNQNINNAHIFGSKYFCPIDYNTGDIKITDETISIHWYNMSWLKESDRLIRLKEIEIRRRWPRLLQKPVCFIYRKTYRLFEYSAEGVLFSKIKSIIIKKDN